jgi:hypothetical protein
MRSKFETGTDTDVITVPVLTNKTLVRREHALGNERYDKAAVLGLRDYVVTDFIERRQGASRCRTFQITDKSGQVLDWVFRRRYVATLGIIPTVNSPNDNPTFGIPET